MYDSILKTIYRKQVKHKRKIFIFSFLGLALGLLGYLYKKENLKSRSFEIKYSATRVPHIYTSLDELSGYYLIDLGASYVCSINSRNTGKIQNAEFLGKCNFYNFEHSSYELEEYLLKKTSFLNVGMEVISFVQRINTNDEQLFDVKIDSLEHVFFPKEFINTEEIKGGLGNGIIRHFDVLLDFKSSNFKIFKLKLTPLFSFPYKNLLPLKTVPFEFIEGLGYVVTIKVQGSTKRFLLDTGATCSFLKSSSAFEEITSDFSKLPNVEMEIGNFKFTHPALYVSKNFKVRDLDGILGMDFFYDKRVFIDNSKNIIFID